MKNKMRWYKTDAFFVVAVENLCKNVVNFVSKAPIVAIQMIESLTD